MDLSSGNHSRIFRQQLQHSRIQFVLFPSFSDSKPDGAKYTTLWCFSQDHLAAVFLRIPAGWWIAFGQCTAVVILGPTIKSF